MFEVSAVHRTLVRAKVLMEEHGHSKGSFVGADGRLCMRAALLLAYTGHADPCGWWFTDSIRQHLMACELAMGFEGQIRALPVLDAAMMFNDEPSTSLATVLARFDQGIEATCDFDSEVLPLLDLAAFLTSPTEG